MAHYYVSNAKVALITAEGDEIDLTNAVCSELTVELRPRLWFLAGQEKKKEVTEMENVNWDKILLDTIAFSGMEPSHQSVIKAREILAQPWWRERFLVWLLLDTLGDSSLNYEQLFGPRED